MPRLPNKKWFLWSDRTETKLPWDRYLNTEFLKSELKRIDEVARWRKEFDKAPRGKIISKDVRYCVLPIRIRQGWLELGPGSSYTCKGLSALVNNSQWPMVSFFPKSNSMPKDYSLVRINKFEKRPLLDMHTKSTIGKYAVVVEDWEQLDYDDFFLDAPFDPKMISELFEDGLGADNSTALTLQSPLASSPHVMNDVGGVALASIFGYSDFADGLCEAVQLMLPPHYRSYQPTKGAYRGISQEIDSGVRIHLAERILLGSNCVSSKSGYVYRVLNGDMARRRSFPGEYSVFGALIETREKGAQLLKDVIQNFFQLDAALPDTENLIESDAYIPDFVKRIDEDVWLQCISMRQNMPEMKISEKEMEMYHDRLPKDLDVVLSMRGVPDLFAEFYAEMEKAGWLRSLVRVANSLARAEGVEYVDTTHLSTARGLSLDTLSRLMESSKFKNWTWDRKLDTENIRAFSVEQILRELGKATTEEVYEIISSSPERRSLFEDKNDVKRLLQWFRRKGYAIRDSKGRYIWM